MGWQVWLVEVAAVVDKGRSTQTTSYLDMRLPVGCVQPTHFRILTQLLSESISHWQAVASNMLLSQLQCIAMLLEVS